MAEIEATIEQNDIEGVTRVMDTVRSIARFGAPALAVRCAGAIREAAVGMGL